MTLEPGCGVMNPVTVVPAAAIARSSLQYQHTPPHTHTHKKKRSTTNTRRQRETERASAIPSASPQRRRRRSPAGRCGPPVCTARHHATPGGTTQEPGAPGAHGRSRAGPGRPLVDRDPLGERRRVARRNGGGPGVVELRLLPSSVGV